MGYCKTRFQERARFGVRMRIPLEQVVAGTDQYSTQGFANGGSGTELQIGNLFERVQLCHAMDQHGLVDISAGTP